jgi:hypothetical protein
LRLESHFFINWLIKLVTEGCDHTMVAFNLKSDADPVVSALKQGLIAVNPERYPQFLVS